MYNEMQKKAFIDSRPSTEKNATKKLIAQIFGWFEPHETDWGMDLSLQTAEVLQPIVNSLAGLRYKSTELVLILLKEYVKWSRDNGYDVSDGIFNVSIDTIDKVKNQMVSSPAHLKTILDKRPVKIGDETVECGFDTPDKETIDITYRVFLWMAFAGLEDKDAIRVTAENVDLKKLRINFEGHIYTIYKESKEDFEKACKLTDFLYEHPNYVTRRDRVEGDTIMRGFRSSPVDLLTIRPIINKRLYSGKTPTKEKISYRRIYLSGIFYRAYEREQMGLPVDFSDVVAREMQGKEYSQTKTRTLTTIANTFEREFLADYEKWKCAFVQ